MSCEINLELVLEVLREAMKPVPTKYIIEHVCEKTLCTECVAKPMVEAILKEGVSNNILGRFYDCYFIQSPEKQQKLKANAQSKKIESKLLAVNVNESSSIPVDQNLQYMADDENSDTSSITTVELVDQDVQHRRLSAKCNEQTNERLIKVVELFAKKSKVGATQNQIEAKFKVISMPKLTAHNEEQQMVEQAETLQQPKSTEAFIAEEELLHTSAASKHNNVQYENDSERVNEDAGLAIRSSGLKRQWKTGGKNEEESVLPAKTAKLQTVASDKRNILVPRFYKSNSEMCVEEALLSAEESDISMQSLKPASNKGKRPQQQHIAKKLHLSLKPVQLKKYQETSSATESANKRIILVPRFSENNSEMFIEAVSHISMMSVKRATRKTKRQKQQQKSPKKLRLPFKAKTSYCKFKPKVQKQIDFCKHDDDADSDSSPDVSEVVCREREAARLFNRALNAKRPATRFGAKKKSSSIKNQKAANPKANFCKPKIMQRNQRAKKHAYMSESDTDSDSSPDVSEVVCYERKPARLFNKALNAKRPATRFGAKKKYSTFKNHKAANPKANVCKLKIMQRNQPAKKHDYVSESESESESEGEFNATDSDDSDSTTSTRY